MPLVSSEDSSDVIRFHSLANLLRIENDSRLLNIFSSISCLMTTANVSSNMEVSNVIDYVSTLRVSKKHLTVFTSKLNDTCLQKKAINFNVVIYHNEPSRRFIWNATNFSYIIAILQMGTMQQPLYVQYWERRTQSQSMECALITFRYHMEKL